MNMLSNRGNALTAILKVLLGLALAVIVGYGVYMSQSIKTVTELFSKMGVALSSAEASAEAQDYTAAMAAAREAARYADEASVKLDGVEWKIASEIPIVGVDADIMRSIGSITGSISNEAIIPVLDNWDALAADGVVVNGQLDMSQVGTKLNQFVSLAETIQSASAIVETCKVQADTLPASHFAAVNDWVGQLKQTIASLDETLDQLAGLANIVTGASNVFNMIGSAA